MSGVREFQKRDIAEVADLWLRVFHGGRGPAPQAARDYFDEIFFQAPWRDDSLPSLVYEDEGRIGGFLGVLPRKMTFDKRPIRVAVATQLAEDEAARSAYAAVKLIKRFFAGPQDLSFSDGANDSSERLWTASGGNTALLYSLDWTRVLRPAEFARILLKSHKPFAPLARLLPPFCRVFDAAVLRSRLGSYWLPEADEGLVDEEPSDEMLLSCVRQFSGDRALQPDYDTESFRWLLREAGDKRLHGSLRKAIVREESGEVAGWYLYYLRPGEVSEVLQFGGRPKSIRRVLNRLFYDSWKQGAVAVSGEMEPRFARELAKGRCTFNWTGGVLAQSNNLDLLNAIQRGDAFLSRLEGEWWARFSDSDWTRHKL